jgi:hypothetical protein
MAKLDLQMCMIPATKNLAAQPLLHCPLPPMALWKEIRGREEMWLIEKNERSTEAPTGRAKSKIDNVLNFHFVLPLLNLG